MTLRKVLHTSSMSQMDGTLSGRLSSTRTVKRDCQHVHSDSLLTVSPLACILSLFGFPSVDLGRLQRMWRIIFQHLSVKDFREIASLFGWGDYGSADSRLYNLKGSYTHKHIYLSWSKALNLELANVSYDILSCNLCIIIKAPFKCAFSCSLA